jgi:long-chain fatty acid transport protein
MASWESITTRVAVLIPFVLPLCASANNGLNQIAFGVEAVGMGGADFAVARDTSALNSNPAGLTQITAKQLDLQVARASAVNVRHKDMFDNDVETQNDPALANVGFAKRLQDRSVTFGFGLFAQGGAGSEYPQVNTAFGTQDELTASFRIGKLVEGAAVKITDSISFGASLAATYADLNQKFFPNTSSFNAADPARSFFGQEIDGVSGVGVGVRLGMMQRINPRVTWAVVYASEVDLELEGGQLTQDRSSTGLGKVTYGDAKIDGLKLPQELGFGLALRPWPAWLLSFKLSWLDWSSAIATSTLTARKPDNPAAPSTVVQTAVDDWRDQYVFAIGFAYEPNAKWIIRGGYNYGRNPIPEENTNPLLAAITENHLTFGFGYRLKGSWQLDFALEYELNNTVTYTNPRLPFGPNAQEELESFALHFGASRRW